MKANADIRRAMGRIGRGLLPSDGPEEQPAAQVEAEIQARLDQQKRTRIERCIKDVMPILDRYGVTVEAQVVIQGSAVASQVIFRTKD